MKPDIHAFTHTDYEILEKKLIYQGVFRYLKYLIRHKLFNGEWSEVITREMLERPSAVAILPYDPVTDRVILIQQFRPGATAASENPWLIEVIAGCMSANENPMDVVLREAQEEAGCTVQALYPLYDYFVSPGASNEHLNLYIGKTDANLVHGIHGLKDEHEDINVINVSADEAFALLRQGKINTSPAILSLQWLEYNRERLPHLWQKIT